MMIPSQSHCFLVCVFLYFFFLISPSLQYCRHDQRDALLEFKHEFQTTESKPSLDDESLSSWNKSNDDCCSWNGVTCDIKSTKVISLYLDSISLDNSLKPNSGLFKLQHLLNLTLRNCSLHGSIPSSLGNLSHLTLLDLTYNNLVGQIPTSIGKLSSLIDLDFMYNNLEGQIPSSIGNLSQLKYMSLPYNKFSGNVPISIVNLTKLSQLNLYDNNFDSTLPRDMSGFQNMDFFDVAENSFVGPFPTSLFTISSLDWVNLGTNHFKGPLDFGNTSLSSRLEYLYLSHNQFDGLIPTSITKFLNLGKLDLSYNNFIGHFPTPLFTIPSITLIDLSGNQFSGPIEFGNKPSSSSYKIQFLSLAENKFDGLIPESISRFLDLDFLDLSYNNLIGSIPISLAKLVNLNYLHLSNNKLEGHIPCFLWGLESAKLSHNSFSGFEETSSQVIYGTLMELELNSNSFQGPLPDKICRLVSLRVLDLSNNSFNGSIPQCLKNLNITLEDINLSSNNFSGVIPDIFSNATKLKSLDVSHNQLEEKLPRSLINCKAMQLLNVQSNKIKDKFPYWLGSLPLLGVILLRENQLYGPVYHRHVSIGFQSLRVIDISHNYFVGTLPSFYFSGWSGMTTLTTKDVDDAYMGTYLYAGGTYRNSMEMIHKGVNTEFERIRKDFRAIDFSRNKFCGEIPESIGFLKELRILNFSSNKFTSKIPESLANLKNLETLDLSLNNLSGQIPQGLSQLSFLSTMNFSHNDLEGPIPQSTQFQSQNCSSFMNNPKLQGLEEEVCGKHHGPSLAPQQREEASHREEQTISWIAATIAYVPGVLCGFVIGHIFLSHRQQTL